TGSAAGVQRQAQPTPVHPAAVVCDSGPSTVFSDGLSRNPRAAQGPLGPARGAGAASTAPLFDLVLRRAASSKRGLASATNGYGEASTLDRTVARPQSLCGRRHGVGESVGQWLLRMASRTKALQKLSLAQADGSVGYPQSSGLRSPSVHGTLPGL